VEEVEPPAVATAGELWAKLVMTELQMVLMPMLEPVASAGARQFLRLATEAMPALSYAEYLTSFTARSGLARAWSEFQAQWPLVLGPVCTMPPFSVGYDLEGVEQVLALVRSMRLVVTGNLLGLPAAVVPVGVANGLPQAVQIIGPRFREDLCLDAAQAIEERLGVLTPIDPRS
jgi:amidase